MNMKFMKVCFVLGLFLLTSIFFSTISARASTTNLVENEFTAEFSPLVGNPDEAGNLFDETNRSEIRTGYNTWEEDWGEGEVPKGIYVGTAFAPSVLDTGFQRVYQRCFLELGFTANFSAKEIMNGVSSFWVKIPVVYDAELFSRTLGAGINTLQDIQSFIGGLLVHSPQTIVVGSSIYVNFHYIVEPEKDYVFMFRLPLIHWDVSEIPYEGYYNPEIAPRILITDEKVCKNDSSYYGFLSTDTSGGGFYASYSTFDGVSLIDLPSSISLGFSFVFTNGVGLGGLFGRSYPVLPYNCTIFPSPPLFLANTTKFSITTILSHDNTNAYPSIVIPFYSINSVYLVSAEIIIHDQSIADFSGSRNSTYSVRNNYSGMFILSFPNLLVFKTTASEGLLVNIYLEVQNSIGSVGAITFLHTRSDDILNQAVSFWGADYLYWNYYGFNGSWWQKNTPLDKLDEVKFIYYDFVCYAEMKSGQWAWVWHNSTGGVQYDYVFRHKIYVPVTVYRIITSEGGEGVVYATTEGNIFDDYPDANTSTEIKYDSGGDDSNWLISLAKGIKKGILGLWDGLKKVYGYIINGIHALGDALYKLGELVVNSLMKFWGVLESIVAFIEDNVLNILELLVTTASAFLFLLIMPVVSRSFKSFFTHVGGNV